MLYWISAHEEFIRQVHVLKYLVLFADYVIKYLDLFADCADEMKLLLNMDPRDLWMNGDRAAHETYESTLNDSP